MKRPIKRKKTERRCPININSLHRRWERGDTRIDWPRIEKLYAAWLKGEKVPWRKLSHTFIKKGRTVVNRPTRQPAREDYVFQYYRPRLFRPTRPAGAPENPFFGGLLNDLYLFGDPARTAAD